MIDEQRAIRAFTDVLAVEWDDESGVANIVTLSDSYMAVPELRQHNCPDREYHLDGEGMCKHLISLEITRGNIDAPEGWLSVEDLDERTDPEFEIERPPRMGRNHTFGAFTDDGETDELPDFEDYTMTEHTPMTDGGQAVEPKREGNKPAGHDQWTLYAPEKDTAKHFDERGAAEDKRDELSGLMEIETYPPGESPASLYHAEDSNATDDSEDSDDSTDDADDTVPCAACGKSIDPSNAEFDARNEPYHEGCYNDPEDGTEDIEPPVVEHTEADAVTVEEPTAQPVDPTPDAPPQDADLPERSVSDELDARRLQQDPLDFLPSYMIDKVQGTPTLNKRGLSVLAFHYGIEVTDRTIVVNPHESDWECAIVETEVTDEGGRAFIGTGTAHVDRGDDKEILLEMAETRSYKRAVSFATGTGIVSYQEMVSELE